LTTYWPSNLSESKSVWDESHGFMKSIYFLYVAYLFNPFLHVGDLIALTNAVPAFVQNCAGQKR
jgi:hypothetical protein